MKKSPSIFVNERRFLSPIKAHNNAFAFQVNEKQNRIVVITRGEKSLIIASQSGVEFFEVPRLEKIIDTNGAGDAFCGGTIFLGKHLIILNKHL